MAGVLGFEPRNAGIKTLCLTTWRHPKRCLFCSASINLSRLYELYIIIFLFRVMIKMRPSNREVDALRVIKITRQYNPYAEGSVLVEW